MRRRRIALGGLLLSLAMTVTACGGSSDEGGGSSAGEADPDGVFVRGVDLTAQGGATFDPATIRPGWFQQTYPVTNSWMKVDENGEYVPDLAESTTIVDSQTVSVTMRSDLQFSDGQPLDAQAAVNSIQRTKDAKAPGLRNAELGLIGSMTVDSPTQFTISLTQPRMAVFYPLLADAETTPVSPTTINTPGTHDGDVITAGPFKIESFDPGVRVRLVKNDLYWDADNVKLAAIEYQHVGDGAAAMNALRGGTIDFVNGFNLVQQADAAALSGDLKGYSDPVAGADAVMLCMRDGEPLGDVRVRQALNYATDRDQLNNLNAGGESEPAWGMVPKGNRLYNEDLEDVYARDVDKAEELLAEAGYPDGLTLRATVPPNFTKQFEILQSQWSEVGVDLQLTPTTDLTQDWTTANGAKADVSGVPMLRPMPGLFFRLLTSDAASNVCHYPVPELDECAQTLAEMDPASDEFVTQAQECQEIAVKDLALTVNTVFVLDNGGYDPGKIGGLAWQRDPLGARQPDVTKLYVLQ
jgi:peptide/nickel transport system substrate-binding protein